MRQCYQLAKEFLDNCEQKELPLVQISFNEDGNANIITNIPSNQPDVILQILEGAKELLIAKGTN